MFGAWTGLSSGYLPLDVMAQYVEYRLELTDPGAGNTLQVTEVRLEPVCAAHGDGQCHADANTDQYGLGLAHTDRNVQRHGNGKSDVYGDGNTDLVVDIQRHGYFDGQPDSDPDGDGYRYAHCDADLDCN